MSQKIVRFSPRQVTRTALGSILLIAVISTGCLGRSPAVEHFILGRAGAAEPASDSTVESDIAVLVGPVKLPAYLERPQMARLAESGEVELAEFSRWLGGFEENFLRSTSLGLARRLGSIKVVVPPSSPPFPLDYRVRLHVDDFVFVEAKETLDVRIRWALVAEGTETPPKLFLMESSQPVNGKRTADLVEAHEVVIAELVTRIADEIEQAESGRLPEGP